MNMKDLSMKFYEIIPTIIESLQNDPNSFQPKIVNSALIGIFHSKDVTSAIEGSRIHTRFYRKANFLCPAKNR